MAPTFSGNLVARKSPDSFAKAGDGTEAALMARFIKSLVSTQRPVRNPARVLLEEFGGVLGRPDLVDAEILALPGEINLDTLAACLSSPAQAKLLSSLKFGAPRTRTYLERVTGLSTYSLKKSMCKLSEAGLIDVHEASAVSLRCRLPWDMVEIVAYEGKLTNSRRALHQAIGYKAFARSVWVVMPPTGARRAKALEPIFRSNRIGLMSVTDNGDFAVEIKGGPRRAPASRSMYLMAVGAVLTRYVAERRRLHRRLRPESIQSL